MDGCAMQQAQEHCRALQQEYRALVADSSVLKSSTFKAEKVLQSLFHCLRCFLADTASPWRRNMLRPARKESAGKRSLQTARSRHRCCRWTSMLSHDVCS